MVAKRIPNRQSAQWLPEAAWLAQGGNPSTSIQMPMLAANKR
jgi:hypothetical protein